MLFRLGVPGLSLALKSTIQECIDEYDASKADAQDDVENVEAQENSPEGADNNARNKRKQGRCMLCDRSKDKKARTACSKCGSFVCTDHMIALCTHCVK